MTKKLRRIRSFVIRHSGFVIYPAWLLPNHPIDGDLQVLNGAVLHADRQAGVTVKAAAGGHGQQLVKLGMRLFALVGLGQSVTGLDHVTHSSETRGRFQQLFLATLQRRRNYRIDRKTPWYLRRQTYAEGVRFCRAGDILENKFLRAAGSCRSPRMRTQLTIVGVLLVSAMLAVPFFYAFNNHRLTNALYWVGATAFIGLPLAAGSVQRSLSQAAIATTGALLLACPLVYAITDPLPVAYEKPRDGFFLGTATTVVFVCAAWASTAWQTRKWQAILLAVFGVVASAAAIFMILFMIMHFE